jgi:hypothetical protein
LSLLSPYKVEAHVDSEYYTFSTNSGTTYKVALYKTHDSYFSDYPFIKSFEISFYPDSNEKSQPEEKERIALTITNMIKELMVAGYIITFCCDVSDNKHKARHVLFNRWFKKYSNEYFRKVDSKGLSDGNNTYYISLLFDVRAYSPITLNQIFSDSIDEYSSYKLDE